MKKLWIIGGSFEQLPIIKEARMEGYFIISSDTKKNSPCFKFADKTEILDPLDLHKGELIFNKYKPDGIISDACDYANYLKCYLSEKYGLVDDNLSAATITCNKYLVREILKNNAIKQPKFFLSSSFKETEKVVKKIGLPVVLKPLDNRGSIGVNLVYKKNKLKQLFFETLSKTNGKQILIEEYISGKHITVDGIFSKKNSFHNIGVAEKTVIEKNHKPLIVQLYYTAQLEKKIMTNLLSINKKIIRLLKFDLGLTHSEYIINKNGIYLVETSNRGAGVLGSTLILKEINNLNVSKYLIETALDKKFNFKINKNNRFICLKWFAFKSGKVKKVINHMNKKKYILEKKLLVKKNQKIKYPDSGANRHGFVIFKSNSLHQMKKRLLEINNSVKIDYEK